MELGRRRGDGRDLGFSVASEVQSTWGELGRMSLSSSVGSVATPPRRSSSSGGKSESRRSSSEGGSSSNEERESRPGGLDDVVRAFGGVLCEGGEIDMARLLAAMAAHLELIRSVGGAALLLVSKDLEGNLRKAEGPFRRSRGECATLSSLLERERSSGIHNGNVLEEESAAMGLLWMRRSLQFQAKLFKSLLCPGGPHPREAARGAYEESLAPFHGWMLRGVFPASFGDIPAREKFLSRLGGARAEGEGETTEEREMRELMIAGKLAALVDALGPLLDAWRGCFDRLGLEDTRRV